MKSLEFIEQLKTLVANEDPLSVSNEVNDLRTKFNDLMLEEERKAQVAQLNAEKVEAVNAIETPVSEGDPIVIEPAEEEVVVSEEIPSTDGDQPEVSTEAPSEEAEPKAQQEESTVAPQITDAVTVEESEVVTDNESEPTVFESAKDEFYSIYNEYKTKKKAVIDERNAIETNNLQEKKGLISKLREVVTTEENIGSAFAAFKEIQENWKEIGDIPRAKRNEVQTEYSKLLEDFFYNIKIYKELKDHDFHRNYQLKMEIIEKLKGLIELKNIKDLETQLKGIQNDWEDVGPVPNDKWEEVKDAYWTEVRSSYDRINRFYDDRRTQQQENLKKKGDLLTEAQEIATTIESLESVKDWDEKTSAILEVQKKWKSVGFGPKKENEEIWKAFRASCDEFFNAKKVFFGKVNEVFDVVAKQKQELIDKAIKLKGSTNWKETSNQMIQLQKEWKKLGHAGRKNEQKLWKAFRGACDDFFNSRNSHFSEQDKEYDDNLIAKQDLLKEIEGTKLPADKKEALTTLRGLSTKFNAIGRVPIKSKDSIFKAFKKAMDDHYGALKMDSDEKESIMFQAKIDTIQASPDASNLFWGMKQDLRKDIDKQNKEINLLENNLGFFANSKGADELKKDVEKKVQRAKDRIEEIKRKLKMVPNE